MTSELITDIGELTGNEPDRARRRDAALVIEAGRVAWLGDRRHAPAADTVTSVQGRAVLPGWVDSHSHLVFAGDRTAEFEARLTGAPYTAGGIQSTVRATRAATDEELRGTVRRLRAEALAAGTTWLETKTGYGLDVQNELRSARIAAEVADDVTFLGAHVVPEGAETAEYVDLVTGPMLEAVRPHVSWIDVFVERGAFDDHAARRVLTVGAAAGLGLRVHGNQLGSGPGARLAVELGAASVDHCNHLDDADIDALASSTTVATLLPACDLCTRQPFGPARALLDAGATIALASNCNPGTSYTTSMPFAVTTAVLQMGLSVEEAVRAATLGGATALRRASGPGSVGHLGVGARADLQVLDAPSVASLAYRPGVPLTRAVWKDGVRVVP
ncbi:imidazolonepropionase [Planctomonas psychrotolerans]|uniref:imidazolonepropionase n=1 Tax=Planctomonas psychrotolerans TaxID=2528712 RepID=UPI001238B155|nr:imidazolonepropionase [Planctomonas psychrotolerans]